VLWQFLPSRGDWIRTSGLYHPKVARYQAAPHPVTGPHHDDEGRALYPPAETCVNQIARPEMAPQTTPRRPPSERCSDTAQRAATVPFMTLTIDTLYGDWATSDADFHAMVETLPAPRPASRFFDRLRDLDLTAESVVLDVGCRDGAHAREIHRAFGAHVIGVDPVPRHLARANARMKRLVERGALRFAEGEMATIPLADASVDASIDVIWCRDVLMHVPDLVAGFAECRRVARDGATMLVYSPVATPLLAEFEAEALYTALAVQRASMSAANIEAAANAAGWRMVEAERVGGQWREASEPGSTASQLTRISRMLRERDALVALVGELHYEVELQLARWGVFQLLGKLEPRVWEFAAG
jgi:SAM-dependent methyltransferase